ncbi:MAG TPA: hypothetical protein VMH39_15880 [Gemmatimonadaceae bacterium]|nr:hypothetical protein [Gemmatimonadaceae bacterium]
MERNATDGAGLVWILLGLEKPPTAKDVESRASAVVAAFLEVCAK